MATTFFHHVVGDLTVGKPQLQEFPETASVAEGIDRIGDSTGCGILVWQKSSPEKIELPQKRFVGILSAFDIVAHLSTEQSLADPHAALKIPVSHIVARNAHLLQKLDPATRLCDAMEMMTKGVRWLLVRRNVRSQRACKRFSILLNGKWLNPTPTEETAGADGFCCVTREDVTRFLIGLLGKLAPIPLTPIESLGAITPIFCILDGRSPAKDAVKLLGCHDDPQAVAVVEPIGDSAGKFRMLGEISSFGFWKCDYLLNGWALGNVTAGEFVMGIGVYGDGDGVIGKRNGRLYRRRNEALTCRPTSSLAAVMAQMLSHRATHLWVTTGDANDCLVGMVTYLDILRAFTNPRSPSPSLSN